MVRSALLAVLFLSFFAAGSEPSQAAGSPAIDATRLWLRAVSDGKAEAVQAATRLPFTYREAWPRKQCSRAAKDAIALGKWLECVRKKENLLLEELKQGKDNPEHVQLEMGLEAAEKKLRGLAKASPGKGTWVNGYINGDGVTYSYLFALDGDDAKGYRVAAMYIDAAFDAG